MIAELLVPAVRSALRRPGFSLVVILIVAVSAGLATTAGNLAYQTLIRSLPYALADRLYVLSSTNPPEGWWEAPGSVAEFKRYQQDARLDDQLAVFWDQASVTFASTVPGGAAERIPASYVEHNFFSILGAVPASGRTFTGEETRPGTAHNVAVISHRFWQTKLGARADAVGATLRLADRDYEIIGVMPAGFRDVSLEGGDPQVWLPLPLAATQLGADLYSNYALRRCRALLRVNDGVTRAAAQAEADEIGRVIDRERPAETLGRGFLVQPVRHWFFWRVEKPIVALFAGALLVLGVAAVNLTNLFLVLGLRRAQELAVRAALGADSRRVGLTVFADALVPLAAGAVAAVTVAFGLSALLRDASVLVLPEFVSLEISPVALLVSVAGLVALVAGTTLVPVLRARRIDLRAALQSGGKGESAAGSARARNLLIAAEVALAAALLFGTGLTAKSLWEMMRRPLGFRPDNLLTMSTTLDRGRLPLPADRAAFTRRLHEAIQEAPGASAATVWSGSMIGRGGWVVNLTPGQSDPRDPKFSKTFQRLGPAPGALAIAGLQLLRGRDFSPDARPSSPPKSSSMRNSAARSGPARNPWARRCS
jgi:predicted permease